MSQTAYVNAVIIDGTKYSKPLNQGSVLVKDGKIEAVSVGGEVPEGYQKVDLQGKYLLPGLINMHCHLPGSGKPVKIGKNLEKVIQSQLKNPIGNRIIKSMCYRYAKTELLSGVTTIRTVGGLGNIDTTLRNEINAGKKLGPHIFAADTAVSVPKGHMAGTLAFVAHSKEEAVQYVKKISETRPDLIKLMITGGVLDADKAGEPAPMRMPLEYVKASCDMAHKLGLPVAAHAESAAGVRAALQGGVDTIEHGAAMDEDTVRLFKETGAKLICTISPAFPMTALDADCMPNPDYRINGKIVLDGIVSAARMALANDIPVGLGNDVGCPYVTHYDFWRELLYFKHLVGVSNQEAIHTATEVNAQILGIDHITGTIEKGKRADFIVCEQDPLKDLAALRKIDMVVIDGNAIKNPRIKKKKDIERLLDSCMFDQ